MRRFCLLLAGMAYARAAQPKPEAIAAYDRYVKLTEDAYAKKLWLDEHKHEKSLVWLNQGFVTAHKTLDKGEEISAPEAVIQDWMGEAFIPGVTLERVRDTVLSYRDFKYWFKDAVLESREDKREGDHFDTFLRLHRRQVAKVVVNVKLGVDYKLADPTHAFITARSTYIGEGKWARKKPYEEDDAPEDEAGYLWRMTVFWRLEALDNGVYVEMETVTLSRESGRFAASRVLNGFVDNFPKQFTEYLSEEFRKMLSPTVNK
jgi:hypothetical protein